MDSDSATRPFRFFDNREKYLLFVTTCSEKWVIAERVGMELKHLQPVPPAVRVFDAGMGDATVLSQTMRQLHHHFPTIPFLIVGKEISQEDVRISLEKMADRFYEHPQTVLVITNLFYAEAPGLYPNSGIRLRRDSWVSVMYAEELNSAKSSVTLQRTDRHEILGQKPANFQLSLYPRQAKCAPDCPKDRMF